EPREVEPRVSSDIGEISFTLQGSAILADDRFGLTQLGKRFRLLSVRLRRVDAIRKLRQQSVEQFHCTRVMASFGQMESLETKVLRLAAGSSAPLQASVEVLAISVTPGGATKPFGLAH